jgi:hypothetical protein
MNQNQTSRCTHFRRRARIARIACLVIAGIVSVGFAENSRTHGAEVQIEVKVDRGRDVGQSFGSLFEVASSDGTVVIGAGFQNLYNTRYRADRHALQFFIRPAGGERPHLTEELPRPNELCGTYLYGRDDVVHSTYGGVTAWDAQAKIWQSW